jgi:hypothetical protein
VNPPHHAHVCIICRGEFPCWNHLCAVDSAIVCEDCAEVQIELLTESPKTPPTC